jgi:methyl-accepting chemotaxis protein
VGARYDIYYEIIIKEQEDSFQHTKGSFTDMNQHVESLINNVNMILMSIQTIESARQATLSAIESISAVSQQTAAASLTVNETTKKQSSAVNDLDNLSKELQTNAQLLQQVIEQLVIA